MYRFLLTGLKVFLCAFYLMQQLLAVVLTSEIMTVLEVGIFSVSLVIK